MRNVFAAIKRRVRYFRTRKYEGIDPMDLIKFSFLWTAVGSFGLFVGAVFDCHIRAVAGFAVAWSAVSFCFALLPGRLRILMLFALALFFFLYLFILYWSARFSFLLWGI